MKSLRDPFLLTLKALRERADERARHQAEPHRPNPDEQCHGALRSNLAVPSPLFLAPAVAKLADIDAR